MEVIWAVLCQNSIIDRNTNNVSLINVLEEIRLSTQPPQEPLVAKGQGQGVPINAQLVTLWVRSDLEVGERGFGRIRIVLPDGESILGPQFDIDLTQFLRLRQIANIPVLPIRGQGIYRFVVESKKDDEQWIHKFMVPLRVILTTSDS